MTDPKVKITELAHLGGIDIADEDVGPIVDVSDVSQAPSGTTKKIEIAELAVALKGRLEDLGLLGVAHATTHEQGGDDPLRVENLASMGTFSQYFAADGAGGVDLVNSAMPSVHALSHYVAGTGPISIESLPTFLAAGLVPQSDGAGALVGVAFP